MEYLQTILLLIILVFAVNSWWRVVKTMKHIDKGVRRVLLDTSVLIDGRILDLAKTGFINDELVVPRSVLAELQLLADGSNNDKRTRARFGLDVITQLQKNDQVATVILPDDRQTPEGVDNRLLELAKDKRFALMTMDYNLNKVATAEGITVLNINELAKVIRMQVLPGEKISLKLIQEGQGDGQAVGYLVDGSMVVVSNSKKMIGQTVNVKITRYLQTDAGKMAFADIIDETPHKNKIINKQQVAKSTPKTVRKIFSKDKKVAKTDLKVKKQLPKTRNQKARQEAYLNEIIEKTSSKNNRNS
ncbi:MAG: hypothetical protein Q3996_01220 [Candidatus Saccharibacteria bacterium]|nr:hypothetical protein [Candidatus Saccharibacteria bacterium]